MKKFNLFIAISLLSFFTCFLFADTAPVINWKICNIITNLDEYLKDYYMVIDCDDLWCNHNSNQPFMIISDNVECFSWWGNIYLIPNDIEFESLKIHNGKYLNDEREIRIWRIYDESTIGDLTHIYEIIRDSEWFQCNVCTWIKLELINEYKWYNVRSEIEIQGTKDVIETKHTTSSSVPILWIIIAFCIVGCCMFILAYLSIKFFKNKKGQN